MSRGVGQVALFTPMTMMFLRIDAIGRARGGLAGCAEWVNE